MKEKQGGIFYGWLMVAFGAVILGVTHGVVTNCFSLYIIPVSEALGVSRQAFAVCNTVVNLLYALISFTSGWIYRRISVKRTMRIAALTLPLFYGCYSLCRSLPAFYLCAVGVGISVSFLTFLPFSVILANWFNERRGQAIGLCFMGSGLGGMVMNTLTALSLERFGWQSTYLYTGIIILAVTAPLVWLVIRVTPEETGRKPLGAVTGGAGEKPYGLTTAEAIRTPSFIAAAAFALCNGIISGVINNTIAPHLQDLGYTSLYAGAVVSAYMGGMAVGKILLGWLYDKIGFRRGTVVSMTAFVVGFYGLLAGRFQPAHALIVAGALGTASANVTFPVLTRFTFGSRDYASLNGILLGFTYVTGSLAVVIANIIFSATGSYNGASILAASLAILSAILVFFLKEARKE